MAIKDTLVGISNLIKDITLTRADINMSNLSVAGKAQLADVAGGVPWMITSNVITRATDVTMTHDSDNNTVSFSGTVTGMIPNGRSVQHAGMCDSIEAVITINNAAVAVTNPFGKPKAVFVNADGAVTLANYVVSYSEPLGAVSGDMWYNLTTNTLSFYETSWTNYSGVKLGTLKQTSAGELIFTGSGTVQVPDFDTILTEIEMAKAPTGTVIAYMGTDEPDGYLLMDGRELSRTTYSRLFAVIGTTQGAGNGSTTFNIANMTDGRYLMGSTVAGGSPINAGVPNVTARIGKYNNSLIGGVWGATFVNGTSNGSRYLQHSSDSPTQCQIDFWASRCSSVYGASETVTPESYPIVFMIRY